MPIVSRSLHQSRTKQNPHQSRRPSHAVLWSSSRQGKSKARRMNRSRVQGYRATSSFISIVGRFHYVGSWSVANSKRCGTARVCSFGSASGLAMWYDCTLAQSWRLRQICRRVEWLVKSSLFPEEAVKGRETCKTCTHVRCVFQSW
jgi:hypothetical protein